MTVHLTTDVAFEAAGWPDDERARFGEAIAGADLGAGRTLTRTPGVAVLAVEVAGRIVLYRPADDGWVILDVVDHRRPEAPALRVLLGDGAGVGSRSRRARSDDGRDLVEAMFDRLAESGGRDRRTREATAQLFRTLTASGGRVPVWLVAAIADQISSSSPDAADEVLTWLTTTLTQSTQWTHGSTDSRRKWSTEARRWVRDVEVALPPRLLTSLLDRLPR